MADETPTIAPEVEDPGPKKSFWGHLADLRSALVKSVIAIAAALLICLFGSPWLVRVLEQPLRHMRMFEKPKPTVTLAIGNATLGPYEVTREQFPGLPPGDAPHVVFRMGTATVNGQQVATLTMDPDAKAADALEVKLHNFSPAEAFLVAFHVALYAAVGLASPFWLYFMGGFIMPALNVKERSVIFSWMGWSAFLFLAGVLSTYFLLLPVALRASVQYSDLLGFSAQDWRAEEYINFACKFIVGMGLGFQFPIIILLLVKIGVLSHADLKKYRRHVAVLSLFLGAILTTPEIVTQVAMAVPLYLLYEVCIWIAWSWERKKAKAAAAAAE